MGLSKSQDWKYFQEWNKVVRANDWRTHEGRLHPKARTEDSEVHQRVFAFAKLISGKNGAIVQPERPTVDNMRHGVHWHMLGKDKSHENFNNADLDRVLVCFRLLINPLDLQARLDCDAYQRGEDPGEVRRHVNFISSQPEAYVLHIIRDQLSYYTDTDYQRFTVEKLRSLTRTLKNRRAEWNKPVKHSAPPPIMEEQNCPF